MRELVNEAAQVAVSIAQIGNLVLGGADGDTPPIGEWHDNTNNTSWTIRSGATVFASTTAEEPCSVTTAEQEVTPDKIMPVEGGREFIKEPAANMLLSNPAACGFYAIMSVK